MDYKEISKEVTNQVDEAIKEFYSKINTTKEDIIKGFIAQYGYAPDECVLIQQQTDDIIQWWVERRNSDPIRCRYPDTLIPIPSSKENFLGQIDWQISRLKDFRNNPHIDNERFNEYADYLLQYIKTGYPTKEDFILEFVSHLVKNEEDIRTQEEDSFWRTDFWEALKSLREQCDLIVVKTKYGKDKYYFTTEINYQGGVCNDCSVFHEADILEAVGFKVKTLSDRV